MYTHSATTQVLVDHVSHSVEYTHLMYTMRVTCMDIPHNSRIVWNTVSMRVITCVDIPRNLQVWIFHVQNFSKHMDTQVYYGTAI